MQLRTVLVVVGGLTTMVTASIPANPVIKHLPARAINFDGSFAGLIFKRQTSCPEGYTACGSGCSPGQCCDNNAGLGCRPGESCTEIDGQLGCCPGGYVCEGILGCQGAVGTGCTPGSLTNGLLCCDAAAPICSTSSGVPYCAGAAASTVYTVNPAPTDTAGFASTTTSSVTTTSTLTITMDSTSDAIPTSGEAPTESATSTTTESDTSTITESVTSTTTFSTESDVVTIQTSTPPPSETETSTGAEPTTTSTSTIVVLPYPTGNGTGNATASVPPPEVTGAASRLGFSRFALTILMGLAFVI
ncbi:hypothetical protein ABW19_dt0203866 [Dactylella cylindrospora]|nr:hypothetical protein ABW19_dt0203866 [Dactylella cylindrospora]